MSRILLWRYGKWALNHRDVRWLSQQQRPPGFFQQFIDNIKQEMTRNKEMKENLRKFREEAEKLEQTDALKKARQKFQAVESEASKSSDVLKETVSTLKEKVQNTEFAKKAGQFSEDLSKTAKEAADTIVERGQKISQSASFKTITETAQAVKKEIGESGLGVGAKVYRPPAKLRMRKEANDGASQTIEINEDATGLELHKDSKFSQSWQAFKDNNPYVNKVLDWKSKYDESDNPVIRASRVLTEKVSDIMGGLFSKTELSETLTEIVKMDADFDKENFLKMCEKDIIPNVLEAMVRGELDILKDWCHEAPYNVLSTPIKQAISMGYRLDCRVLDVDNVDLAMGKVMEQGPVLIISFVSQQIMCVRDAKDNIVEGHPEKVLRVNYVWVLCRDQTELDPKSAWRLMDLSANSSEQLI